MVDQSFDITPDKVRELRESRNLSRDQLAKILGVNASTVFRWEAGKVRPTGAAAAIMLAMLAGPVVTLSSTALLAAPWAASAFGIYKLLKEVFEPSDPEAAVGESKKPSRGKKTK